MSVDGWWRGIGALIHPAGVGVPGGDVCMHVHVSMSKGWHPAEQHYITFASFLEKGQKKGPNV